MTGPIVDVTGSPGTSSFYNMFKLIMDMKITWPELKGYVSIVIGRFVSTFGTMFIANQKMSDGLYIGKGWRPVECIS